MTPLQKEIEKVLAPYNRNEPVAEVEAIVLSHIPYLKDVSEERFASMCSTDEMKLGIEIMLAANEVRESPKVRECLLCPMPAAKDDRFCLRCSVANKS